MFDLTQLGMLSPSRPRELIIADGLTPEILKLILLETPNPLLAGNPEQRHQTKQPLSPGPR